MRVGASLVPMAADYGVGWDVRGAPEAAAAAAYEAYHARWADEPLKVCLDLRGFYVKIGQVMSGQPDLIPEAYGDSLKVLQESVPPQPFELVRSIVEAELGCPMEDVFSSFDREPIGAASIGAGKESEMPNFLSRPFSTRFGWFLDERASLGTASIGQVHRATLRGGRGVVVKVQYPDTEKFFRMDFDVILRIFQAVNPELVDALEIQRRFARPYDARHPSYPAELRDLTNPPEEVFAVVKLHYGGSAGIAEGLRTFGFESLADAMGPKMSELFEIASFNAEYAMVQRLGFA
ncbi:ABC1 family-like protein [Aureococcus anophagefferens]|nr:ABC1 family-like protein [Aureococcus anophagefferens]